MLRRWILGRAWRQPGRPHCGAGRPLLAGWLLAIAGSAAWGQVTVNQILFPSNIGRTLDATVTIDYTRTSAAAASIQTVIPPQLGVAPPAPPAGCAVVVVGGNPAVDCTVPAGGAGATGQLTFQVRGVNLGAFSLVATGTGGSSANNPGTIRSSGELSVSKAKAPVGNLLVGQSTTFTLNPLLAAGADDLPGGATLTISDQLPGTATDFSVATIAPGIASCNSVAAANASRTVSCTFTGPLTAAAINAASVVVTGTPGTSGTFTNVASVAADQLFYFDRDPNNNIASVNYTVDPASDVQALGSFPAGAVATGSAQTLTLTHRNNGPTSLPSGGTVGTTIPAGFTVSALPAGCSGPAVGAVLAVPTALDCTTGALASGAQQSFVVSLLMPAAAASGNFVVTVATPAGFGDAVPGNNSINLPYQVTDPFADLRVAKSKLPAAGPIAPGSTVTTTLTVTNDAASTTAATYSANGGGTELQVVDFLRPTEIAGDALSAVSAGWTCSVSNNADPLDATRSKRVLCVRNAAGTLAVGASLSVSFSTTVAPVVGQVVLANRACGGETVLSLLGLAASQGPQPPGSGQGANDCASAGSNLIATDVVAGSASVAVLKESSIDGVTWVDAPGAAPTLAADAPTQHWRITITTPAGGAQAAIPTLTLGDTLPGILDVASPGVPAPGYQTPVVHVLTNVSAGAATGSCPDLAAGASALQCTFTAVAPGTTIVVSYQVNRPFASGTLTNTATLSSPDAILSGTTSDAAALVVPPRIDVAATTKTVTPGAPRVGQILQFTITAQNLGPDDVTAAGDFKIVDDLNTDIGAGAVAFADISAAGTSMSCVVAGSALAGEAALAAGKVRVRCTSATAVPRYSTRTITINARVLKPAGPLGAGTVYAIQGNTARVDIPDALCEFKTETSSNGSVSVNCNDAASTSNNSKGAVFDVLVPQIDLQQRKTRVLPAGQSAFGVGQPLRYRFRLQNNGPSRAEGVTMNDLLTVPAGFALASPQVFNVNGVAAEAGYTLDGSKNGSVSCTQAAPNANLICVLSATPAANVLDAGKEVNFEVELLQSGNSNAPVSFRNEAMVCGDESAAYESSGACNRAAANNNNVAAVNDTIFPRTDLALTKTTVTPSPVAVNQPVEFRLVASNLGPNTTQQIRVVDTLPVNFELLTSGPNAPSVTAGAFVTAAPSTATGATVSCTPVPATITAPGQQQTVSCVVDATPGPLGSGAFPAGVDPTNTLTLRLFARPKDGFFSGPYLADLNNSASVSPGQDGGGNPLSIDTVAGNNNATSTLQVARASLAGRVFLDRNGNGQQDGTLAPQDEGIGTVAIALAGTDSFGNPVARNTTTVNAIGPTRGDYLFDHLPPGTYTVTETQPAGLVNSAGTPPPPSNGGTYTAAAGATTSTYSGAVVAAGNAASGYHFPESPPPGGISGLVWVDRNLDGVFEAGEPPIAGVTLALYPAGTVCPAVGGLPGGALQTVTTDGAGRYAFSLGVAGGNYTICQQQPPGYGDRPPQPGTNGATPRSNQIDITNLPAPGSIDNNFPERLGRIAGTVFADYNVATPATNNNGVQNAGEPGIGSAGAGAGVAVTLSGTPIAGPGAGLPMAPLTMTTAVDGSYAFDDLFPGTYTVTEAAVPAALGVFDDGINTAGAVAGGGTPGVAGAVGDNAIRTIVLAAAGASSSGNNFAELPRVSISGVVYVDRNRDGVLGPADPGRIAGVTIELRQGGTACANATLIGSTTTAADGSYAFPGGSVGAPQLNAGQTYRVCQLQPSGYTDGSTNPGTSASTPAANEIVVATLPASGSTGNHFGELGGALAGSVYRDFGSGTAANDNNGVRDAGETGIAGVPVTLFDRSNARTVGTVLTDPAGNYRFDDLPAGTYAVAEGTIPPVAGRFINGRTTAGQIGGSTAGQVLTDLIESIVLPAGGVGTGFNFGELDGGTTRVLAISGTVYVDRDRDGRLGPQEFGRVGGVVIRLVDGTSCSGTELARTSTDRYGMYSFPGATAVNVNLVAGRAYSVCEVQPADYGNGSTNPGSGNTSPAPDHIVIGALANDGSPNNDFGERGARLAGRVFLDRNNDGAFNGTDVGIPPVKVTLTGSRLAAPLETVTDIEGRYVFEDLPQGSYTVTEQPLQPNVSLGGVSIATLNGKTVAGSTGGTATPVTVTPSAIAGVPLAAGGASVDNNFAEILPASISGRVWADDNNDGVIQPAEAGIGGVIITLSGIDDLGRAVSASTTAAADGSYAFVALRPGTYTVVEPTQPPVTRNGTTVPGSAGGTATPPATLPSSIAGIVLGQGVDSTGNHFGEVPQLASIAGRVWLDLDDDGRPGTGEPGIAGVTIELNGTDSAGRAVARVTVTDAQGRYQFDDLNGGVYQVREPVQPPATLNGRTVAGSLGGLATPVITVPSQISLISLPAGQQSVENNFGELRPASLSGRVWNDLDNDGVVDAGETGIGGVPVTLTGNDTLGRPVNRSTTTDADGRYRFDELPAGTYVVTEPRQPGGTFNGRTVPGSTGGSATEPGTTPSSIGGVTLAAGRDSIDNNFGEIPASTLSGRVWIDGDNDGRIGAQEIGIGGVTVTLGGTDDRGQPVTRSTVTGPDGRYRFDDLRPGTYTVTEPEQPAGTRDGRTQPGSHGGTPSDVGSLPSTIATIPLPAGSDAIDYNFGERVPAPDLVVGKTAREARFTVGRQGHYAITVRNVGDAASSGSYTVSDRLPAGLTLATLPSGSGWNCTGAASASSFSCSSSVILPAGASHPGAIEFAVQVAAAAAAQSPAVNAVLVDGGGEPGPRQPATSERDAFTTTPGTLPLCTTPATHNACRTSTEVQLTAALSGTVWLELGPAARILDAGDRRLPGWRVELIDPATGAVVASTTTGPDGRYRFADLDPGVPYVVRFRDPATGIVYGYPVNGENGTAAAACNPGATPSSCIDRRQDPQIGVVLAPGQELTQQSLPVDPSGVVYDAVTRDPVPGTVVTLTPAGVCAGWNPATQVAGASLGGYVVQGSSIAMTTGSNGFYQVLLLPGAPARCTFELTLTPPPSHGFVSTLITPQPVVLSPPGAQGTSFAVQPQVGPPTADPGPGTVYYLKVEVGSTTPEVVHNHIPVDPMTNAALSLRKTGDKALVELGDTVRYSVTVRLNSGSAPRQVTVVDRLPAGFTYVPGTAMVDGRRVADPAGAPGPRLAFQLGAMPAGGSMTLQYRSRAGVGAAEGDGVNTAVAYGCGAIASCVQPGSLLPLPIARATNEGRFRVRVAGGVFGTDACVLGKVFVDCNHNHVQDAEELGIPGVRLVLQDGTMLVTDSEGKYSACGLPPRSHVLRVDETTLPRGARLTTSSNRNLGDAGSLWLDLKNGELHRADVIEGSCSNLVLDQVKARRAQGEVRAPETEKPGRPALRFDSKAHGRNALTTPQQGTDSASQAAPRPRPPDAAASSTSAPGGRDGTR